VSQRPNGIFVGVKPFMVLAVRVKCALSAKPAAWAASVAVADPDTTQALSWRNPTTSAGCRIGEPVVR
jgi:hypothetical protein